MVDLFGNPAVMGLLQAAPAAVSALPMMLLFSNGTRADRFRGHQRPFRALSRQELPRRRSAVEITARRRPGPDQSVLVLIWAHPRDAVRHARRGGPRARSEHPGIYPRRGWH